MVTGMLERIENSPLVKRVLIWVKRVLILERLTAFGALVVGGIVAASAVIGGFWAWMSDFSPMVTGAATLAFALAAAIGIPIAIRQWRSLFRASTSKAKSSPGPDAPPLSSPLTIPLAVQTELNELRDLITKRAEDHGRALELIEKTRGDLLGNIQASQGSLLGKLQAHQMLYALYQIMPKINRLTEALDKPNTNWAEWNATYQEWRSLLGEFEKTLPARWQIADDLWSNPGDRYRSDNLALDEDKYPTPIVLHDFKTFRIYLDNYNEIRGVVIPKLKREAKVRKS